MTRLICFSGILSLSLMKGGTLDKSTESQLQDLLGDVVLYETEMLNFNKTGFENLRSHSGASSRTELEAGEQLKAGVQLESGEQLETREQLEAGEQLGTGDAAHSAKLDKNQQVCNDGQQGDIGYVDLRLKQFKEKLKQLLCSEG